jgi:hypothetical protein
LEQHQPGSLYDFSMTDLRYAINVHWDARNVIIARQQECIKVEAYSPTNYHIPQGYLSSTWKHKSDSPDAPDARIEQPARGKTTLSLQERFKKALHSYWSWHPSATHSTFESHQLRSALGAPAFKSGKKKDPEERQRDYSRDDLCQN